MEYDTNFLYNKGYKKNHIQILKIFGVAYIIFPLMAFLNYEKYDTIDNTIITSIILAITFVGGNIATIMAIKTANCIVHKLIVSDFNITIITKALFHGKQKQIVLNKGEISVSKGNFSLNDHGKQTEGIIIRNRKTKAKYFIFKAYFDEYEELVKQLKK